MAISVNEKNRGFNDIELTKYDAEFISLMHNELTLYGELQHSIPQRQIIENIKKSARYFYNNSNTSVSESFFILRASDIKAYTKQASQGSDFNGVRVKLPPQIHIVKSLNFIDNPRGGSDFDKDYGYMGMGMQSGVSSTAPIRSFGFAGYGGIDKDLYLIESVVKMVESRAIRSMTKNTIPFSYSQLSNELVISAQIKRDIGLHVKCALPIYHLYNDDLFVRYVTSLCHQSLKRKIGGLVIELPSGATMNADEICNKVEDQIIVEEILKNSTGLGSMFIKRS